MGYLIQPQQAEDTLMKILEHLDSIFNALAAIVASIGAWRAASYAKKGHTVSSAVFDSLYPKDGKDR